MTAINDNNLLVHSSKMQPKQVVTKKSKYFLLGNKFSGFWKISKMPSKSFDKFNEIANQLECQNNIKFYDFDLLDPAIEHIPLVHCISSDLAQFKGLAKKIRQKYFNTAVNNRTSKQPPRYDTISDLFIIKAIKGEIAHYTGDPMPNRTIIGLITKGTYFQKPTYKTLFLSLQKLLNYCKVHNIKELCMPMIGCGLDKLDAEHVKVILAYFFNNTDITVHVSTITETKEDTIITNKHKFDEEGGIIFEPMCGLMPEIPEFNKKITQEEIIETINEVLSVVKESKDIEFEPTQEELDCEFDAVENFKSSFENLSTLGKKLYSEVITKPTAIIEIAFNKVQKEKYNKPLLKTYSLIEDIGGWKVVKAGIPQSKQKPKVKNVTNKVKMQNLKQDLKIEEEFKPKMIALPIIQKPGDNPQRKYTISKERKVKTIKRVKINTAGNFHFGTKIDFDMLKRKEKEPPILPDCTLGAKAGRKSEPVRTTPAETAEARAYRVERIEDFYRVRNEIRLKNIQRRVLNSFKYKSFNTTLGAFETPCNKYKIKRYKPRYAKITKNAHKPLKKCTYSKFSKLNNFSKIRRRQFYNTFNNNYISLQRKIHRRNLHEKRKEYYERRMSEKVLINLTNFQDKDSLVKIVQQIQHLQADRLEKKSGSISVTDIPAEVKTALGNLLLQSSGIKEIMTNLLIANIVNCFLTIICSIVVICTAKSKIATGAATVQIITNLIMLVVDIMATLKLGDFMQDRIEQTAKLVTTSAVSSIFKQQGMELVMNKEKQTAMKDILLTDKIKMEEYLASYEVKPVYDFSTIDIEMVPNYEENLKAFQLRHLELSQCFAMKFLEKLECAKAGDSVDIVDVVLTTSGKGNRCLLHATMGKILASTVEPVTDLTKFQEFLNNNEDDEDVKVWFGIYKDDNKLVNTPWEDVVKHFINKSSMHTIDFCSIISKFLQRNIVVDVGLPNPRVYGDFEDINNNIYLQLKNQHYSRVLKTNSKTKIPLLTTVQCSIKYLVNLGNQHASKAKESYHCLAAQILYVYNTKVNLKNVNLQSKSANLDAKAILDLATDTIATMLYFVGVGTTNGDIATRMIQGERLSTSTTRFMNDSNGRIENIAEKFFDIYMSDSSRVAADLIKDVEKLEVYNKTEVNDYSNNLGLFNEMKLYVDEVGKRMISLKIVGKDVTNSLSQTQNQIKSLVDKLKVKISDVNNLIKTVSRRQDPVAFYIFGAKGAGKTTASTSKIVPDLVNSLRLKPGIYSLENTNDLWNPYRGEEFALADEFLALMERDPLIPHMNQLLSSAPKNLAGADLIHKESYFNSKFVFAISNLAYSHTGLPKEAESAFYGRYIPIQFINCKQDSTMSRANVPHIDYNDPMSYELRIFTEQIDAQFQSLVSNINETPDKHSHLIDGKFDEHVYSTGTKTYRLMTFEQLNDYAIKIFREREVTYHRLRESMIKTDIEYLIKSGMGADLIINSLKSKGYSTIEIQDMSDYLVQNAKPKGGVDDIEANHYVVSLFGDTGTGKSCLATQIALDLQLFLHHNVYAVRDWEDTKLVPTDVPVICVFHDSIYDELAYINFYDKLCKPSILITTSNHIIKRIKCSMSKIADHGDNAIDKDATVEDQGFFRQQIGNFISKLRSNGHVKAFEVNTLPGYQPQPGYGRRLGLFTAVHKVGEKYVFSQRRSEDHLTISCCSGFNFFKLEGDNSYKTNGQKIVQEILLKYSKCKTLEAPILTKTTPQEYEEKLKLLNNQEDVSIQAENIQELIRLTNSKSHLIQAVLCPGINPFGVNTQKRVVVSKRVQRSDFMFNPLDFAIPKDVNLESALEYALKSYRLLLSADKSYTVKIACEEFHCIGVNGHIYYKCGDYDTVEYAHTYESKQVKFKKIIVNTNGKRTEEDLFEMNVKDLAELIHTGVNLSSMFHQYPYAFVRYVFNLKAELEHTFPEVVTKLESKLVVYDEATREKMKFYLIWEDFKQTIWFKIGVAILGLAASYLVISLVSSIWGLVTGLKKSFVSSIQIKDTIVPYEITDVNVTDGNVKLKLYCVDNIDDDLSKTELKNRLKTSINSNVHNLDLYDNQELESVKELDIDIVELKSDWPNKKDKSKTIPQPVQKLLRSQLVKKNSTLENVTKVVNSTLTIPPPKQTLIQKNQIDSFYKHLWNSFGQVEVLETRTGDSSNVKGINICENYIICPNHAFVGKSFSVEFLPWRDVPGRIKSSYPCEIICQDVYNDIVLLKITDKTYPRARNIINYFGSKIINKDRRITSPVFKINSDIVQMFKGNCSLFITDKPFYNTDGSKFIQKGAYLYASTSVVSNINGFVKGDCGVPFIDDSSLEIIGIFTADTPDGRTSCARVVTRDMLNSMIKLDKSPDFLTPKSGSGVNEEEEQEWFDALTGIECLEIPGPKNTKETIIFPTEIANILLNLEEPEEFFDCLNGEFTHVVGYTRNTTKSHKQPPKYQRTPFADEINNKFPDVLDDCTNAVVDPKQVKDTTNLVKSNKNNPSIIMTQINKINDPIEVQNEVNAARCLAQATQMVKEDYVLAYSPYHHEFLNEREMINGLINPEKNLYGNLEAINKHSAAGRLCATYGRNNIDDVIEQVGVSHYNNQPIYSYKNDKVGKLIKQHVHQQRLSWKNGIRYEGLTKDNLKAELRPIEKVNKGKTRVFESFDLFTMLNFRHLFGTIQAAMKVKRSDMSCQIGLDVVHFTDLFDRFVKTSIYATHGDFEAWDKHMLSATADYACEVWAAILWNSSHWQDKHASEFTCVESLERYLKIAMKSNICAVTIADGYILTKTRGNCSGVGCTTSLNSTVNDILLKACIIYLFNKHNVTLKVLLESKISPHFYYRNRMLNYGVSEELVNTFMDTPYVDTIIPIDNSFINKLIDLITYGDDIGIIINQKIMFLINFVTLKDTYMHLFGVNLDSPHKDGSIQPFINLNELDFVSRQFYYDQDSKTVLPRLKETSIWRQLFWISNNTKDQIFANLDAISRELIFYPKEKYKIFETVVKQVINPYLQRTYNATWRIPSHKAGLNQFIQSTKLPVRSVVLTDFDTDYLNQQIGKILELHPKSDTKTPLKKQTKDTLKMPAAEMRVFANNLIEVYNASVKNLPGFDKTRLKLSGTPAIIDDGYEQCLSVSCEIGDNTTFMPLVQVKPHLQKVCNTMNVRLCKVQNVRIYIPAESKRFQFTIKLPATHPLVIGNQTAFTFSNIPQVDTLVENVKSLKVSDLKPCSKQVNVKQSTVMTMNSLMIPEVEGMPAPFQQSLPPGVDFSALGITNYHHKNPETIARSLQPCKILEIASTTTANAVLGVFSIEDFITQDMVSATKDCATFEGSIEVDVAMFANPTVAGVIACGSVPPGTSSGDVTESLMSEYDKNVVNVTDSQRFSFVLRPYFKPLTFTNRLPWLSFNQTNGIYSLPDDTINSYNKFAIIALNDFVSINGSSSSKVMVKFSVRFGDDFVAYSNGPQSTGATLTDSAWIKPKSIGSGSGLALADLVPSGYRNRPLVLDGNYVLRLEYSNTKVPSSDELTMQFYPNKGNDTNVVCSLGLNGDCTTVTLSEDVSPVKFANNKITFEPSSTYAFKTKRTSKTTHTIVTNLVSSSNLSGLAKMNVIRSEAGAWILQTDVKYTWPSPIDVGLVRTVIYDPINNFTISKEYHPISGDNVFGPLNLELTGTEAVIGIVGNFVPDAEYKGVDTSGPLPKEMMVPLPNNAVSLLIPNDSLVSKAVVGDGERYCTLGNVDFLFDILRPVYGLERNLLCNLHEKIRGTRLFQFVYDVQNKVTYIQGDNTLTTADYYQITKYTLEDLYIKDIRLIENTQNVPSSPINGVATRLVSQSTNSNLYDSLKNVPSFTQQLIPKAANVIAGAIAGGAEAGLNYLSQVQERDFQTARDTANWNQKMKLMRMQKIMDAQAAEQSDWRKFFLRNLVAYTGPASNTSTSQNNVGANSASDSTPEITSLHEEAPNLSIQSPEAPTANTGEDTPAENAKTPEVAKIQPMISDGSNTMIAPTEDRQVHTAKALSINEAINKRTIRGWNQGNTVSNFRRRYPSWFNPQKYKPSNDPIPDSSSSSSNSPRSSISSAKSSSGSELDLSKFDPTKPPPTHNPNISQLQVHEEEANTSSTENAPEYIDINDYKLPNSDEVEA